MTRTRRTADSCATCSSTPRGAVRLKSYAGCLLDGVGGLVGVVYGLIYGPLVVRKAFEDIGPTIGTDLRSSRLQPPASALSSVGII
jgi:hypothetical protein